MINVEETKTEIKQEPVQETAKVKSKKPSEEKAISQTLRNPYTGELETDTNKIKEVKND